MLGVVSLQVSYVDHMIKFLMEPLLRMRAQRPTDEGNPYEDTGLVSLESRWTNPNTMLLSVQFPFWSPCGCFIVRRENVKLKARKDPKPL
jgi:hypothetical protein